MISGDDYLVLMRQRAKPVVERLDVRSIAKHGEIAGAGTSGGVTWSPNQHRQARGIIAGILQNNPHIMMDTGLLRHVQQGVPIAEVAGLVITTPALWNLVALPTTSPLAAAMTARP